MVFDYLPDHERQNLLDAAGQFSLRAYLTDGDLHYYLLTGKFRGAESLDQLVAARIAPLRGHPAYAGAAILSGYPPDRVRQAADALQKAGIAYLVPGQGGYEVAGATRVAWLDANAVPGSGQSQIEQLLLEFNAEISAGWNDGVVIDFAPRPIDSAEVEEGPAERVESDDERLLLPGPTAKSQLFAVESLLVRANRWGQRLRGFARAPVTGAAVRLDPALQTAVFAREKRRYLFLFNHASQPVRGPVRVPGVLDGQAVARAVEIPATNDRLVGSVFETRGSEIAIHVQLRPGDAALFELF